MQYPRWLYECLSLLAGPTSDITLRFSERPLLKPTGKAFLAMIESECRLRDIKFKVEGIKYKAIAHFPEHGPDYAMDWFEGQLKPSLIEIFLEKNAKFFDDDLNFDLRLLFSELTQNAKDHSGSERFLVLLERNGIGVFDLGVGIPAKLSQKYKIEDDMNALALSLKEGITTRRLRPGGKGLHYTLALLKRNQGSLTLVSGNAQFKYYLKNKKIDRKKLKSRFPGTLIYCEIKGKI
jgi:hypothetical protein